MWSIRDSTKLQLQASVAQAKQRSWATRSGLFDIELFLNYIPPLKQRHSNTCFFLPGLYASENIWVAFITP